MTKQRPIAPGTIFEAIDDTRLFARWFRDRRTWAAWFAFLAALFGLSMTKQQLATYRECTGRTDPPTAPADEAWLICGRRAGKSFVLALVAVFLACFRSYAEHLQPGERATVLIVARDRRQARVIFRYVRGLLTEVPMLAALVERETDESFDLSNAVTIEIATASFRSVRGYTIATALCDELAFWPTDDSAEPDYEILDALRPGMLTIPGAMLLCASSPYARRGSLWDAFRQHYGRDGDPILVWRAATRTMNPTVKQSVIDAAIARDPARFTAEYMAEFRSDLEAFVSREVVEACVPPGVYERAPVPGITYRAFVDPAGGSGEDSMTLAIAHRDGDRVILDALRERQPRPRFSPDDVVQEFAATLKAYGISSVRGDQYGGDWPAERFRAHGIAYEKAGRVKSDIYRDVLPLLNAGRVELIDHPRLVAQLCSLERRTARGGRDSIDHAPGAHDDLINSVAGALIELSPTSADAWITYVKAEAARAKEAPVQQYDDDRSRFYLPNNSKCNDPPSTTDKRAMHPLQPTALIGNPYSDAYFGAISAAENRPVAMATPRCSHCGAEIVGTRLSDGVRSWCHGGCQQNWIKARVEKNRARAAVERGARLPSA